jgi:hypothetical protein
MHGGVGFGGIVRELGVDVDDVLPREAFEQSSFRGGINPWATPVIACH